MKKNKKNTKNNLSKKLLLSFLGYAVLIIMGVTFLVALLAMVFGTDVMENAIYVTQAIILALIIFAFYRVVDRLIVHRLQVLSAATAKVAEGDYEIAVPVKGDDELSMLMESFNQMAKELQANAFLSKDFARYVSHEFKTPLCVIRNYAEITQDDPLSQETGKNMEVIISETDRLTSLSKDMLELCKLDSSTIIEKKDTFSPASQIRSIVLDHQMLWGEKEIEMIPELEAFEIKSNEALLFRVWQNIIGNAIKFTNPGGCISISLKQEADQLICRVTDNGIGISDEDKQHIFTPFYSGSKSHNKEGNGLGLSLSKKIVEKLGGTIAFESAVGKGTAFTVTIPL